MTRRSKYDGRPIEPQEYRFDIDDLNDDTDTTAIGDAIRGVANAFFSAYGGAVIIAWVIFAVPVAQLLGISGIENTMMQFVVITSFPIMVSGSMIQLYVVAAFYDIYALPADPDADAHT